MKNTLKYFLAPLSFLTFILYILASILSSTFIPFDWGDGTKIFFITTVPFILVVSFCWYAVSTKGSSR